MQVNKSYENKKGQTDLFDISSTKELLIALLLAGGFITVVSISPAILVAAVPVAAYYKEKKNKKFQDTFRYLRKNEYVQIKSQRGKLRIELTEKGKNTAKRGYFKINISKPKTPKKWDGVWRIIIFDVPTSEHVKRNAFRLMIKRIGAHFLQQSVWVYPYDCSEQINFLKNFFELDDNQVRLIEAHNIGNDASIRKHFKI